MVGSKKRFKVVICGNAGVGKTSLRQVYMGNKFKKNYMTTLGADFSVKDLEIDDQSVNLQIWDLAGQHKYGKIRDQYYKDASGVLLVFDITNIQSFNDIPHWLEEYTSANNGKLAPLLLIANKHDLVRSSEETVETEEIENYVEEIKKWGSEKSENFNIFFALTSARYDLNVDASFTRLTEMMLSTLDDS